MSFSFHLERYVINF